MSKSKKKKKSIVPNLNNKSKSSAPKLVEAQIYHQRGPLPAPEQLNKYNQFIPGSGERIIKMAEDGSSHVREMDKETFKAVSQERRRAQWMGFVIAIFGMAGAVYLGLQGHIFPSISIGLFGTVLITVQVVLNIYKK